MTARRAAAVVAGLALAFTSGYVARGAPEPPRPNDPPIAVVERYPATAEGAARAAADHLRLLGDQRLLDEAARPALLDAAVTPTIRPDVEASIRTASQRLGGPDDVVSRIGVLGTRVEEYADHRAVVSIWHVAVAGSTDPAAGFPVQAMWRTARVTVIRHAGSWLLDGGLDEDDVTPGPVPAFAANQPAVSSLDDLARVARDYRGAH